MDEATRKRTVRIGILALLPVGILLRVAGCGPVPGSPPLLGGDGSAGGHPLGASASFTIEGTANEAISPGVMTPLDLKITNPHDFPVAVSGLALTIREVKAPNATQARLCSRADFAMDQVPSRLMVTVAGRSTSTLSGRGVARGSWPQVGMRDRSVNQDGCKGAMLSLAYTGSGSRSR